MSTVIDLDQRGFQLGSRLERRLVPRAKSGLDAMDERIKYFAQRLVRKVIEPGIWLVLEAMKN